MSKKQESIINGIDVSECPLYDKNTGCYHTFNGECVQDSCGVYKWLLEYKRLLEENEELRQVRKNSPDIQEPYIYLYRQIKKQCHKLEEENKELKEKNKNYAMLMLAQQEISQKHWECIGKIKQAIEVLAETCNVYPLKTNLDKLITTINEALNDR